MPALEEKSDIELLLDYSSGKSHAAFEALVQRHGSMVQGVSRRVLSNHHDAEDVTQATFLVLAREASKLSKEQCLAGWLHTVARRLSLNALKSRKLREAREYAAMNEDSRTDTPSDGLQVEFGWQLDAALSSLPERYRQPLVLFHLEGASIEEASRRLNLRSGTFRTRLGRARALLRDALLRRGVKVASVSMLAGMLAAESEAATLGASGAHGISKAVLGKSALGAGAQSLADGLVCVDGLSGSTLSISIITVMKTKASIIAAAVLAAAALFISGKLVSRKQAVEPLKHEDRRLAERRSNSPRSMRSPKRESPTLSTITKLKELNRLLTSVFLIADEGERLQAIRQQLGMNISDQVYRRALDECRYEVDPEKQMRILCQKWTEVDGEAAIRWAQGLSGDMGKGIMDSVMLLWMAQNEDEAMAWAMANLEPSSLEEARNGAETIGKALTVTAEELAGYFTELLADKSLPKSERRRKGTVDLDEAIRTIGYKNPDATLEFIKSHGLIAQQGFGWEIREFFKGWAGRDPDAALAAVIQHLEGEQRKKAMLSVLECWQIKYPHRSLDEVVDLNHFADEDYEGLERMVTGIQARVDPERALQRAMQADNPEMLENGLDAVMKVRAILGEDEITDWVYALPEGEQKDISLDRLARAVSDFDLEGGAQLVGQISDPKRRDKAVSEVLSRYVFEFGEMEAAMRMADQSRMIPIDQMSDLGYLGDADETAAFTNWLETRRAQGRIKDDDMEYFEQLIRDLEERKKQLK